MLASTQLFRRATRDLTLDVSRCGGVDLVEAQRLAGAAICICSIGPATTAALVNHGVSPDLESSRSTMGMLVVEASAIAAPVLARKRAVAIP